MRGCPGKTHQLVLINCYIPLPKFFVLLCQTQEEFDFASFKCLQGCYDVHTTLIFNAAWGEVLC